MATNVAEAAPLATVTVEGTGSAELLLARATAVEDCAALARVTVQAVAVPAVRLDGVQAKDVNAGGAVTVTGVD